MRVEDLKKREGEVVILDLVNGVQATTKLVEVVPGDELINGKPLKHYAVIDKILMFSVSVEPANPMAPPGPDNPLEHKVRNVMYGYPLFEMQDDTPIDVDHIVMAHTCHADMAKVYTHVTSGIQLADAGALKQLDAAREAAQRKGKIQL